MRWRKRLFYQGAKVVADKISSGIPKDTGDFGKIIQVLPQLNATKTETGTQRLALMGGYDSKGVPNQLKARAIESGTSLHTETPICSFGR